MLAGLRLLIVSYWSNLVGCLLMVGLFDGGAIYPGRDHYLIHLAEAKCSLGWGVVVVRGERGGGSQGSSERARSPGIRRWTGLPTASATAARLGRPFLLS